MGKLFLVGVGACLVLLGLSPAPRTDNETNLTERAIVIATGAAGLIYGLWLFIR